MRQPPSQRSRAHLSRRTILAFGPACLAATVAGCATPDTTTPGAVPPDQPAGAVGQTTAAGPTAQAPVIEAKLLATTDEIPVGGGKVVSGVLIVQPFPGLFKAFDARCPHLAAIVSPPKDGVITCNVHGSKFVDIDGSLIQGPAPRGLKEIPIEVEDDKIITA